MEVVVRPLTEDNAGDLNRCDNSFVVDAVLSIQAAGGRISYTISSVLPYTKRYDPEPYEARAYIERTDRAGFFAYAGDALAGQILLHENWNRVAVVLDIAVDPPFRRAGVGTRLMAQAERWARARGLRGMMLETQNVNAGACRFYEHYGYVLGGFDNFLYRGLDPGTAEIALFWYLWF